MSLIYHFVIFSMCKCAMDQLSSPTLESREQMELNISCESTNNRSILGQKISHCCNFKEMVSQNLKQIDSRTKFKRRFLVTLHLPQSKSISRF